MVGIYGIYGWHYIGGTWHSPLGNPLDNPPLPGKPIPCSWIPSTVLTWNPSFACGAIPVHSGPRLLVYWPLPPFLPPRPFFLSPMVPHFKYVPSYNDITKSASHSPIQEYVARKWKTCWGSYSVIEAGQNKQVVLIKRCRRRHFPTSVWKFRGPVSEGENESLLKIAVHFLVLSELRACWRMGLGSFCSKKLLDQRWDLSDLIFFILRRHSLWTRTRPVVCLPFMIQCCADTWGILGTMWEMGFYTLLEMLYQTLYGVYTVPQTKTFGGQTILTYTCCNPRRHFYHCEKHIHHLVLLYHAPYHNSSLNGLSNPGLFTVAMVPRNHKVDQQKTRAGRIAEKDKSEMTNISGWNV